MSAGVTSGRAASCTSRRSAPGEAARTPSRTDSARLAPPATTRTPPTGPTASRTRASSPGGASTTISSTRAVRRRASTLQPSIGRPASGMSALGTGAPMRVPAPAATRIAVVEVGRIPPGTGGAASVRPRRMMSSRRSPPHEPPHRHLRMGLPGVEARLLPGGAPPAPLPGPLRGRADLVRDQRHLLPPPVRGHRHALGGRDPAGLPLRRQGPPAADPRPRPAARRRRR